MTVGITDWTATLLDPIYGGIGVAATITLTDTGSTQVALTVIDKTEGVELDSVSSIKPAAVVRMKELASLSVTRSMLDGASIAFNGSTWRIDVTAPKPTPGGEADGELYLILTATNA